MFYTNGKVALITGGASGIGLSTANEFLKRGIKGITIADLDTKNGESATEELKKEFGSNRIIFIKTDVTRREELEDAFKRTVEVFGNVDILVNSAGICNDNQMEKEIAINVNGAIYANLLAMDKYLPGHKSGDEGVIVNISSMVGLVENESLPIYAATKHAMVGLSKSLGTENHYKRTKVRVLTICPGATTTPIFNDLETIFAGPRYKELYSTMFANFVFQKAEEVAKGIMRAIEEGSNGSTWLIDEGKTQEVKLPKLVDLLQN